jgi:hypothetical protein
MKRFYSRLIKNPLIELGYQDCDGGECICGPTTG